MNKMILPIIKQFQFSDFIMNLILSDLKNEDAIKRIRNGEGCSITWVIGHLCAYRYRAMKLIGVEKENEFEQTYGIADANDGKSYPNISEMLKKWHAINEDFYPVLEGVSNEQLQTKLPKKNGAHDEQTVLEALTFYTWHESSHLGAVSIIRKELGYPATYELVMEMMKKKK